VKGVLIVTDSPALNVSLAPLVTVTFFDIIIQPVTDCVDDTVLSLKVTISPPAVETAAKALHKPYPISLFHVPLGRFEVVEYEYPPLPLKI